LESIQAEFEGGKEGWYEDEDAIGRVKEVSICRLHWKQLWQRKQIWHYDLRNGPIKLHYRQVIRMT